MESTKFWDSLSRQVRQQPPCERGWALLGDASALEAHCQECLPCRQLHAAHALARATRRYLRMERTPDGLQPRLYVSPALPGYLRLELPAAAPQVYAAGSAQRGRQWAQQAVSDDEQLLLTLRPSANGDWELTARYLPGARWRIDDSGIAYAVTDAAAETEPPECLACLILDYGHDTAQARLAGWFVPEGTAFVARLRVPRPTHAPAPIAVGLLPARALRWLTPDELERSRQCALHPDAQAQWDSWRARYAP